MEEQTEILVIGTHPQILETVLRLLNKVESWNATGVSSPHEALEQAKSQSYQVLLLGAGLEDEDEDALTQEIRKIQPGIHVIPHYGGGSGLLYAEIYLALGIRNQAQ